MNDNFIGCIGIGKSDGIKVSVDNGDFFGFGINERFHFIVFLIILHSINLQYHYGNFFLEFMAQVKKSLNSMFEAPRNAI